MDCIRDYSETGDIIGVIYTGDAGDMSPPLLKWLILSPPLFESIWLKCSEKSSEPRNVKGLFAQNKTCNAV